MKETPLVSLIVPVFNAEDCIEDCVASIVAQTYKNLEVLLVDDGSNDGTPNVLKKIAAQDNRIKILPKKNGGVSSARNLGLDNASGDYLGFVDADDTVSPNMVEVLLSACLGTGSDVSCCGFGRGNRGYQAAPNQEVKTPLIMNQEEFLLGVIEGCKGGCLIGGYLCNKLFAKSLFHKIKLEVGRDICEDLLCVLEVGQRVERACVVPDPLYNYTMKADSATHRLSALVTPDERWAYFEVAKIVRDRYGITPALAHAARLSMCKTAVNGLMHLVGNERYRALYDELQLYVMSEWSFYKVEVNVRQRARTWLVTFHPMVYAVLKRIGSVCGK